MLGTQRGITLDKALRRLADGDEQVVSACLDTGRLVAGESIQPTPRSASRPIATFLKKIVVAASGRWFNWYPMGAVVALNCAVRVDRFGSDSTLGRTTMRKLLVLAAAGVLFCGIGLVNAQDDKKVTISGDGMCAKCALGETKSCQNAVIETKDGKKTTYYIVHDAVAKKAHSRDGFCQATKDEPVKVKVTGTVEKKDDKMFLTAEKIEKE